MTRALVVAALILGSAAGLGGCGGKPLSSPDRGHAGVGGDAAAGAGAPDAGVERLTVAEPAPDASGADAAVERADAPPVADVAPDRPTVPDARPIDARDGAVDVALDAAKDATPPDGKTWDALPKDWLAFDVTATIALTPNAGDTIGWASFPTTVRFSMGWRPQQARLTVNGGSTVDVSTADRSTFEVTSPLDVNVPFPPGCNSGSLQFEKMTFSFGENGLLRGSARGVATFWMDDVVLQANATFTLAGGPDVTPPTLTPVGGVVDPLMPVWLQASEALVPATTVTLVGTKSGDRIPLAPLLNDDPLAEAVATFAAPNVVLRWNEVYKVEAAGALDLGGNPLVLGTMGTETTPATPPLQAENGFETISGPAYAGAAVLEGGPLVIGGTTSLLVGNGVGFQTYKAGTTMALRLAVAPGDTVVRLQARLVTAAGETEAAFRGLLYVGVAGGTVESQTDVLSDDVTQVSLGATGTATVSAVQTVEIALPAGAKDEVSFEILAEPNVCGVPPLPTLLVIDDLRVE